jgi:hypothetical protein
LNEIFRHGKIKCQHEINVSKKLVGRWQSAVGRRGKPGQGCLNVALKIENGGKIGS